MNTNRTTSRAVALVFALFVTLATLAGIDRLATSDQAGAQWATAHATQAA